MIDWNKSLTFKRFAERFNRNNALVPMPYSPKSESASHFVVRGCDPDDKEKTGLQYVGFFSASVMKAIGLSDGIPSAKDKRKKALDKLVNMMYKENKISVYTMVIDQSDIDDYGWNEDDLGAEVRIFGMAGSAEAEFSADTKTIASLLNKTENDD